MAHRPRKRFGQHFLHDPAIIGRIVAAVAPAPGDELVEIGPGGGALTGSLLASGAHVTAIEIDRDLAAALRERFTSQGLELIEADVLSVPIAGLAAGAGGLRVIGNLPYNISTPLVFHLLDALDAIRDMHIMVQREVGERMAAGVGSRAYGRLGVMIAAVAGVRKLFDVGPGAFNPPPKVHSSVVRIVPHPDALVPMVHRRTFADLVRVSFSHRRKTLRRSLGAWLDDASMRHCGVEPGDRPERVSAAAYARLARHLHDTGRVTHKRCG